MMIVGSSSCKQTYENKGKDRNKDDTEICQSKHALHSAEPYSRQHRKNGLALRRH
jgi:hypothetical protein